MKKILLGLCLLSLILIVGCSSDQPSIGGVACNADTLGTKEPWDCNTCTCVGNDVDGYGWACTEIGCGSEFLI